MGARETLKLIYKVTMIVVTAALAAGAVAAWWYATPANGLLLVAGILAILTLIAGLSINKLEWQDQQAEGYREIADDIRTGLGQLRSVRGAGSDGMVKFSFGTVPVDVEVAEPEVHRVDPAMLDEAKRMAAAGAPIDNICRTIDPAHDSHEPVHQEAFRRVVRAMIEQG
jgi:hypothetical protein